MSIGHIDFFALNETLIRQIPLKRRAVSAAAADAKFHSGIVKHIGCFERLIIIFKPSCGKRQGAFQNNRNFFLFQEVQRTPGIFSTNNDGIKFLPVCRTSFARIKIGFSPKTNGIILSNLKS